MRYNELDDPDLDWLEDDDPRNATRDVLTEDSARDLFIDAQIEVLSDSGCGCCECVRCLLAGTPPPHHKPHIVAEIAAERAWEEAEGAEVLRRSVDRRIGLAFLLQDVECRQPLMDEAHHVTRTTITTVTSSGSLTSGFAMLPRDAGVFRVGTLQPTTPTAGQMQIVSIKDVER